MTFEGVNEFSQCLLEFCFELFPLLFCHCFLHGKIIQHPKTCGYTHEMSILFEGQLDPKATAYL